MTTALDTHYTALAAHHMWTRVALDVRTCPCVHTHIRRSHIETEVYTDRETWIYPDPSVLSLPASLRPTLPPSEASVLSLPPPSIINTPAPPHTARKCDMARRHPEVRPTQNHRGSHQRTHSNAGKRKNSQRSAPWNIYCIKVKPERATIANAKPQP